MRYSEFMKIAAGQLRDKCKCVRDASQCRDKNRIETKSETRSHDNGGDIMLMLNTIANGFRGSVKRHFSRDSSKYKK